MPMDRGILREIVGHVDGDLLTFLETQDGRLETAVIADTRFGKVTGIAPQASETTHTFPVIVWVENTEGRLGSGMLVRATLSMKDKFDSLAVSKDAIIRQGEQTMVYTIVDGKAVPIMVMMSSSAGTMVAVAGEGLVEGMPVVVRGNERIFPGSPVRTPEDSEQQGGAAGGGDAAQSGGSR